MPGDLLIARSSWLCTVEGHPQALEIVKGDRLLVVSSVAAVPRTTGEVYVEDLELIQDFYTDRYYVQALWRDQLVGVDIHVDDLFCNVFRERA